MIDAPEISPSDWVVRWPDPNALQASLSRQEIQAHASNRSGLSISPNGRYLRSSLVPARVNAPKGIGLSTTFDLATGKPLFFAGREQSILTADWSHVVFKHGQSAKVAKFLDRREFTEFHADQDTCVKISPDGKYLAAGKNDGSLSRFRVWNASSRRPIYEAETEWGNFGFSPDSRLLLITASSPFGNSENLLVSMESPSHVVRFTGKELKIEMADNFSFSSDSKHLAFLGRKMMADETKKLPGVHRLCVYQFETNSVLWEQPLQQIAHDGEKFAWSPNGKWIVAPSEIGTHTVFDSATGEEIALIEDVKCFAFSPDSEQLAVATNPIHRSINNKPLPKNVSERAYLAVRDTKNWELQRSADLGHTKADAIDYSRDGSQLILRSKSAESRLDCLELIDSKTLRTTAANVDMERGSRRMLFTPDGTSVLTTDASGMLLKWDPAQGELQECSSLTTRGLQSFELNSDNKLCAWCDEAGKVSIGDPLKRTVTHEFESGLKQVRHVAWILGGQKLLVVGRESSAVYDLETKKLAPVAALHESGAYCVAVSADGSKLASYGTGSVHDEFRLLTTQKFKDVVKLNNTGGQIVNLAISADGNLLASVFLPRNGQPEVRVANTTHGKIIWQRTDPDLLHQSIVAFSPDGTTLAYVSYKKKSASAPFIELVKVPSGESILNVQGPPFYISSIAFSPMGDRLAAIDNYGKIGVWAIPAGTPINLFETKGPRFGRAWPLAK